MLVFIKIFFSDVPDHSSNVLESSPKTSIIQSPSGSTRSLLGHTSKNFIARKGDGLGCKDSTLKQSLNCKDQELRTESSGDQCVCSDSSTQTCNLSSSEKIQAPVKTSCASGSSSDLKFVMHQYAGMNKSSLTNCLPQQKAASSDSGSHNGINHPITGTRDLGNHNRLSTTPLSSKPIPPDLKDPFQINPLESRLAGDCSSFSTVNSGGDVSTVTSQDKDPGLPSTNKSGVNRANNSDSSAIDVGDAFTKTRPQDRDNVQWSTMPLPLPSSVGTAVDKQTESHRKNKLPTIALTSAEKPGVVYKAIPLESLLQKGMWQVFIF